MRTKKARTKKHIKDTYIKLLDNHEPLDVSVSELCEAADINRSTFYEYYSYIEMMIDEIIYDQIDSLSGVNNVVYDEYYYTNTLTEENVKNYIKSFADNKVLIKLIKSNQSSRFKAEIIKKQVEYEINRFSIKDNKQLLHVIFRSSGVLSIVFRWMENKKHYDLDDVASELFLEIKKVEQ